MALIPRTIGQQRYEPPGTRDFFYEADKNLYKFNQGIGEPEFGELSKGENAPQFVRDYNEAVSSESAKTSAEEYGGYNYAAPQPSQELFPEQRPAAAQPPTAATQNYVPPAGIDLSGRMTELLEKDNPFITRRRSQALRPYAARGLQNTSMAAQGGELGAIEAALPIATAESELFASLYGQERGGEIESGLSSQQAEQQGTLYKIQGDITSGLSRLDHAQNTFLQTALKGMDIAQQTRMAEFERTTASTLSAQEAAQARKNMVAQIDAENVWEQKFLNKKIALERSQIDAGDRENVRLMTTDIESDYQRDRLEIMLNPNFATPEDRLEALSDLDYQAQTRMSNLSTIYGVTLDWGLADEGVIPPVEPTPGDGETPAPELTTEEREQAVGQWIRDSQDKEWYPALTEGGNVFSPANFYNWSEKNKGNRWFTDMTDQQRVDFFKSEVEPGLPSQFYNF